IVYADLAVCYGSFTTDLRVAQGSRNGEAPGYRSVEVAEDLLEERFQYFEIGLIQIRFEVERLFVGWRIGTIQRDDSFVMTVDTQDHIEPTFLRVVQRVALDIAYVEVIDGEAVYGFLVLDRETSVII